MKPLSLFASCLAVATLVIGSGSGHAQDRIIRLTMARSIYLTPVWGIEPFAKKYGLKVEFVPALTNPEMQRNLQSGVEVGSIGYQSAAILADQKVKNVKIIAGIAGGDQFVVRKGVAVTNWHDLEGKRIGAPPGSYVAILFALEASEHGVDLSKVQLVNVTASGPAELNALKTGDLDGLVLWSPFIDQAVVDGYAYYADCCRVKSPANQVLAANTEFLKDRNATVKFLKAFTESVAFYDHNPEKAYDLMHQVTGIRKDVFDEAWKHALWDIRIDIPTIMEMAKEGPHFGFTRTNTSATVTQYVDLHYLSEATGRSVEQLSAFSNQ